MTSEIAFDTAAQEKLRAQVKAIMEAEGLSQKQVSDDCGIAYGTFTAWLAGTYTGNNEKQAAKVHVWLEARAERNRARTALPKGPGFVPTKTARDVLERLTFAQAAPDFAVVIGSPGIGKTASLNYYAATNPNVWVATAQPSTANVHALLSELADTMKLPQATPHKLAANIIAKVRGTNALIAIDEAQHLQSPAIDELRSIHDKADVGIAVLGNEGIVEKLGDPKNRPRLAQLFSRVGVRLNRTRPLVADIEAYLDAWNVEDEPQRDFLKAIALKPGAGALRAVTKTLRLAGMVAAGAGGERTMKHLRSAWAQLGDVDLRPKGES